MRLASKLKWFFVAGRVEAHNRRGTKHFHNGELADAEEELREAVHIFPEHHVSHCNLGMVLHSQRKAIEAEREFKEAIRLKPDYADAHRELGFLYHKWGRREEARREYEEAIRLDPNNASAHINLATLLRDDGDFSGADREYRAALSCPDLDEGTRRHLRDILGE